MRTSSLLICAVAFGCGEQKFLAVNAEPDVDITSHENGDVIEEDMSFWMTAVADDADDSEDELVATWSAGDQVVCDEAAVNIEGITDCSMSIGADEGEITVVVRDPRGSAGGATVRLEVLPTEAPSVEIWTPDGSRAYYVDHIISFEGLVTDAEDEPEDLTTQWKSDRDGVLDLDPVPDVDGIVGGFVSLSEGPHEITLTAEDTTGRTKSDAVFIDVGPTNTAPSCAFVSPPEGAVFTTDAPVELSGTVNDPNVSADHLSVTWSSDQDGELGVSVPETDGTVSFTASELATAAHTISMQVVDEVGASCTVTRLIVVTTRPDVEILEPTETGVYYNDHAVTLSGLVTDLEDGSAALTATWESSLDGVLPVASTVSVDGTAAGYANLVTGEHIITLTGEDADGQQGSDSVVINVGGPNRFPDCVITSPASGLGGDESAVLNIEAEATDPDISSDLLTVIWTSDLHPEGDLGTSTPTSDGLIEFALTGLRLGTHTVSMTVADEVGATCTDSFVYIVGRAPDVEIGSPVDGDTRNQGTTVLISAVVSDADEPPGGLGILWESDLDGVLHTAAADDAGTTQFTTDTLSRGVHTISLTVTDDMGLYTTELITLTINGLPTAPAVRIMPDPPTTTDTLTVMFDSVSTDPDGDALTYRYEWWKNGVVHSTMAGSIGPSDTAKDDSWLVRVTPMDDWGDGASVDAVTTIVNSPPVIDDVDITPSTLYTDSIALSAVSASDADGDDITIAHAWNVDGLAAGDDGDTLDGTLYFDRGQVVGLTVTPWDGEELGPDGTATPWTVINRPPTAVGVSILPVDPIGAEDDMLCSIDSESTDADGDTVTYSFVWTVDGFSYPGSDTGMGWSGPMDDVWSGDVVPGTDTVPEELWSCTATPSDGFDVGPSSTVSAITRVAPPRCGDDTLDEGEEYDPPPGPFLNAPVDPETCRWDFSAINQLYCGGFCDWAGEFGCDDADADILCKLKMDNPDSVATAYTILPAPMSEAGFPSSRCGAAAGLGVAIYTDRGVPDVRFQDESLLTVHGAGDVVAFPTCTDP